MSYTDFVVMLTYSQYRLLTYFITCFNFVFTECFLPLETVVDSDLRLHQHICWTARKITTSTVTVIGQKYIYLVTQNNAYI